MSTINTSEMSAQQIAYLGMGSMGSAMAKNLAQNGGLKKPIILWNRTLARAEQKAAKIEGIGAIALASVEETVRRSDIIFSCLADQDVVFETYDAILKNVDVTGKLFVDCSTISPEGTNTLAQRILYTGGEFVGMPVLGAPQMAEDAKLTVVPAGASSSVIRLMPYLKGVIAKAVVDMSGEAPGMGSHLKLISNIILMSMIESVSEAHVLAEKTGLPTEYLDNLICDTWGNPMAIYSTRMANDGGYYRLPPVAAVSMGQHVASHVLGLAADSGTELGLYKVVAKHLDMVAKHGGGKGDIVGIYGAVREESGLDFETES